MLLIWMDSSATFWKRGRINKIKEKMIGSDTDLRETADFLINLPLHLLHSIHVHDLVEVLDQPLSQLYFHLCHGQQLLKIDFLGHPNKVAFCFDSVIPVNLLFTIAGALATFLFYSI